MEKLLVMQVAALLTEASCANAGGSLAISADLSDANVRSKNLMVWEVFRVFYHALIKALADDNPETGWPKPSGAGSLPSAIANLPEVLGNPALSSVVPLVEEMLKRSGASGPTSLGAKPSDAKAAGS